MAAAQGRLATDRKRRRNKKLLIGASVIVGLLAVGGGGVHLARTGKRQAWVAKNKNNESVKAWLEQNPPPKAFKGTKTAWAFREMPKREIVSGRKAS